MTAHTPATRDDNQQGPYLMRDTTPPNVSDETHIPQVSGWVGIISGHLTLIRTYADATMTAAVRDTWGWGPEVELARESVPVATSQAEANIAAYDRLGRSANR